MYCSFIGGLDQLYLYLRNKLIEVIWKTITHLKNNLSLSIIANAKEVSAVYFM